MIHCRDKKKKPAESCRLLFSNHPSLYFLLKSCRSFRVRSVRSAPYIHRHREGKINRRFTQVVNQKSKLKGPLSKQGVFSSPRMVELRNRFRNPAHQTRDSPVFSPTTLRHWQHARALVVRMPTVTREHPPFDQGHRAMDGRGLEADSWNAAKGGHAWNFHIEPFVTQAIIA